MLLSQLGLLFLLLPLCSFAPGFFFVRKLRWNPLEKLCGSIGLSLLLLYLAAWGIYCSGARGPNMPVNPAPYAAISLVCLGLAVAAWKDARRLFRSNPVRRAMTGFGFLLVWTWVMLAIIRNYTGGLWFADWLEHFQRTVFFLKHLPAETAIFPGYAIPARPPLMNVLTAFFLAQTSDLFELFQAAFVFLNLLLFLPCYLMMPALGRKARRRIWLLVLFFAASPVLMQNITYCWTKSLAAFFVVLAIWFYLAGWRKGDSLRLTAAFICLAGGVLVHYSAGPYVVILALHYLIAVFPHRPNKWRELATIGVTCGLLLATWLGWSVAVYGTKVTVASNSTVTFNQQFKGSTIGKFAGNLFDSIVPAIFRDPSLYDGSNEQRTAGAVRDFSFMFYQVNAIFGMGLVGGPLVVWWGVRAFRRRRATETVRNQPRTKKPAKAPAPSKPHMTPERKFWAILTAAGFVLGIAVVGERDPFGSAHLTMLALEALGITMLAAVVPWRRGTLTMIILAGCVIDFSFGVFLHARVENLENSASSTVYPGAVFEDGKIETALPGPDALSHSSWNNWFIKHQLHVYEWWLGDMDARYSQDPVYQKMRPAYLAKMDRERKDDMDLWQGWFARHGGGLTFLGDHVAGFSPAASYAAMGILILMFVGLAGRVFLRAA